MKGWVPGFAKKTLARRPLVIAKVAEYLERKTERMRTQPIKNNHLQAINSGHSRRPSVMSNLLPPFNHNRVPPPTESNQQSILLTSSTSPPKKHITFVDTVDQDINSNSSTTTDSSLQKKPSQLPPVKQHLYPSHRHPIQKVESIQLLKKLTYSIDNWKLTKETGSSKHYILNSNIMTDEDEFMNYQGGIEALKRKVPFIRADGIIHGGWTAEQLCSVIHCFGSRRICKTNNIYLFISLLTTLKQGIRHLKEVKQQKDSVKKNILYNGFFQVHYLLQILIYQLLLVLNLIRLQVQSIQPRHLL